MSNHPPQPQDLNLGMNNVRKQLNTLLATIKEQTGIPGISLALNIGPQKITANTGTISIDSDIPMNENTHFQIGCISKLMTAMVVAELISAGKLHPEDSIKKYLDEFRGTERGEELQIWHLLSHTSGYQGLNIMNPSVAYNYSWAKFLEYIKTTPQFFKPGTVLNYEHTEYVLLGEIIKRVTGSDILDLYNEMIIDPLKLKTGSIRSNRRGKETYAVDHKFNSDTMTFEMLRSVPYSNFWKASLNSLTMSIKDILRISSMICGINKPPAGISENALKFVQKQVIKIPQTYGSSKREQIPVTFGVGCAFYRGWILGHNGSARGQSSALRFDPRSNIALAVGINTWMPSVRDSIIKYLFESLRGQPISQTPEVPFETSLDDLAGNYFGPKGCEIVVTYRNEQLISTLKNDNLSTMNIVIQKDDRGVLRVQSDTLHYSIGFFHEPESGFIGLMLGTLAFRKQ